MAMKVFENPLIPHARMRALYRAMVELQTMKLVARRTEACWAASLVGADAGDFVGGAVGEYLRRAAGRETAGVRDIQAVRDGVRGEIRSSEWERVVYAAGAAAALRGRGNAAVAMVAGGDLTGAQWRWVLNAAEKSPLVAVALPGRKALDLERMARRLATPVIAVESTDAVAIYRVVQESLVRARADGQGVVVASMRNGGGIDPIAALAEQMVVKGIATRQWLAGVDARMARLAAH